MNSPLIIPGAEPFFIPGGRTGVLLVHGLTGAPKEMRWMGEDLASRGYTVMAIRLAGHATRPRDLMRMSWRDWLASVEDGFRMLSGCCDDVFIMGLSLGAVLTLTAAAYLPVRGAVAMSTPYRLPYEWLVSSFGILKYVLPRIRKGPANWHNPQVARDHIEYPFWPTAALAQLRILTQKMRADLPAIQAPVLLMHSRQEKDLPLVNMERIFASLGTKDKHMLVIENSGHMIPRESDRQIAFQAAHEFIQRCLTGAGKSEVPVSTDLPHP